MAIRGVIPQRGLVPKATCPKCRRPVALLKSGRCVYCGADLPGAREVIASGSALPAEVLVALEPRSATVSPRGKWIWRVVAFAGSALLTAALAGPCMKS